MTPIACACQVNPLLCIKNIENITGTSQFTDSRRLSRWHAYILQSDSNLAIKSHSCHLSETVSPDRCSYFPLYDILHPSLHLPSARNWAACIFMQRNVHISAMKLEANCTINK